MTRISEQAGKCSICGIQFCDVKDHIHAAYVCSECRKSIMQQPLLTEEGFINPACLNELESAIKNLPKTHERLSGETEWNAKHWTFRSEITGYFAMWACRQSPYGVPDGLENVCKYLDACLRRQYEWSTGGMEELSLCEINKVLYDILYEQGVKEFDEWNRCKKGDTPEILYTSSFDKVNPDYDFIDLDALLHNVCISIRDERRKNKAFDEAFQIRSE